MRELFKVGRLCLLRRWHSVIKPAREPYVPYR